MVDSDVADSNTLTNLGTGEFQLGDQDLYVIYPTTEKALFDTYSLRRANDEWPISGNNTKSRKNECTKILGLQSQDTIQLRLDDPTVEDHKFTNDDDECAVEIDGWEAIWRLGDDWTEGQTTLDVHFSRKEKKAIICAFDDS